MFEIHVGELRATFLRNHNMRHHNDPTKCPKPGRQLKPRRPPQPRQPPQPPQARGRCTRYVAVHPLRGSAPEQKRCIAYGSGALPQQTRTNAELTHRTTHRHTPPCAAGPYWRQDGHAAHATTRTPAHSGPTRHLLHPYMRRARLPIRIQPPTSAIAGEDYMPQRTDRRAHESGARRPSDQQPSA